MIAMIAMQFDDVCHVCDDNDHCLPRWEDDGGGIDRPPTFLQTFEANPERNEDDHERTEDEQDQAQDQQQQQQQRPV